MEFNKEQLILFKSLFKGRTDVFAQRWTKGAKSGYYPVYYFDPYHFKQYKLSGGSFKEYPDKSYLPLTDDQTIKHFTGEQHIGLYPLLQDNTSWFIAADFDKKDWSAAAIKFMHACEQRDLFCYLERSRSGNGGHVWIFFESPIAAFKTRKIITNLLTLTGAVSSFDKGGSFDRLFPNQDKHTAKAGLGNLIALPFNGTTIQQNNTCFLDPETLTPFPDQWAFLARIKRVPTKTIEDLHQNLLQNTTPATDSQLLTIILSHEISLNKLAIPAILHAYIKDELNITNLEYIIKKNSGRSTYGKDKFFNYIRDDGDHIYLPKGFIGKLIRFCRNGQIIHEFLDLRTAKIPQLFSFNATLRAYQEDCVLATTKKEMGVIVAPPASGKTVIALKIVAEKRQPALILVHRKQLETQWIERIETFLGIPKREIGKINPDKNPKEAKITVATIQSFAKVANTDIFNSFGLIIVDECHHIPASTFSETLGKFNSRYLYGLTATPFRKYSDGRLIFIHLGELIYEISRNANASAKHPEIIIKETPLYVPFNAKTDRFETLSNILIHDSERNRLILTDVYAELKKGRKCVILTERKEHIETLEQYLKQSFETVSLSGADADKARKAKWNLLKQGNYQVLITTGQLFGEGSDLHNAECLFLVYPFSFEGKLIQYMGRVQRSELTPTIYDYRDGKIDYLNRMFMKRNVYYSKLKKQLTLFDFPPEEPMHPKPENPIRENQSEETQLSNTENATTDSVAKPNMDKVEFKDNILEKTIKIKIQELEFLYGSIQFSYAIPQLANPLTFDIENEVFRPEFEVLKPYIEKLLKSKTVEIDIIVVSDASSQVKALSAKSVQINQLNKEIIESVRFQFVSKNFTGRKQFSSTNSLQESSGTTLNGLYESNEEVLSDILTRGQYKHQKQLRFLAKRHEGEILKIRFILQPFSFVFLLAGSNNFHLILETLDSEEATYIWHVPKNPESLKQALLEIDLQLNTIRKEGRQKFLEQTPDNFYKIIHEYSDENKGFIVWKDQMEECLF